MATKESDKLSEGSKTQSVHDNESLCGGYDHHNDESLFVAFDEDAEKDRTIMQLRKQNDKLWAENETLANDST